MTKRMINDMIAEPFADKRDCNCMADAKLTSLYNGNTVFLDKAHTNRYYQILYPFILGIKMIFCAGKKNGIRGRNEIRQ